MRYILLLPFTLLLSLFAMAQKPGSGNAISFDGIDDYVSVSYDATGFSQLSIEFWYKKRNTTIEGGIFQWADNSLSSVYPWILIKDNGTSVTLLADDAYRMSATGLTAGTWYHMVISYDAVNWKMYLNGNLVGTAAGNIGTRPKTHFFLGNGYPQCWNGQMDEIRIWNTALTESQIRNRMCRKIISSDLLYPNLVAYYNLDESSGNLAFDATVNLNNGILTNSPARVSSGAHIGNVSSYNYSGAASSTTLIHPTRGDAVTATLTAGGGDGVHVYCVTESPNTTNGQGVLSSNNSYFGVFPINGSGTQYTAIYNFTGINLNGNPENLLRLYKRKENAETAWQNATALLDEPANTLTATGQNTEYMIGLYQTSLPSVILYENHFEFPNIVPTQNCAPDFDATPVNTLWSGTGSGTGGGGLFAQQFTVETILINGPSNQYNDPGNIGSNYSIGMLSTLNDDRIALTLNSQSYPFINITFDLSAIAINGCGFGGALATPVMNIKLYDTPSGTFDFNNPGTLLDNKMVTGIAPNDNPFTFNWARLGTALNNGNTTNGLITVVMDLLDGNYSSFDNLKIESANIALPLNLLSFSGSKQNNDAVLHWKTANEINVSRFEVQRSSDGQTFTTLGNVAAGGSLYSFTDANTFSNRTVAFYRLKSIDADGRFTYSNIIKLSKQASGLITVFPNPVNDVLTIGGIKQGGFIRLFDANGKLFQQQAVIAQTMTIDISKLAKGIYLLQYLMDGEVMSQKIIKQ